MQTSARMHRVVAPDRSGDESISLILPAWNESQGIVRAIDEADEALATVAKDYEIIVVDDGSRDGTGDLVRGVIARNPRVRLITHAINRGYGASLRSGFETAEKALVMFTDADSQFDLKELDRFVLLSRDYDIVCGYRIDRKDSPLRCFYSLAYNCMVRVLLRTGLRDIDCAMKLFHRDVLKGLQISGDGFLVNSELITQANQQGRSIVEVGVSHRPRTLGQSTVSIRHIPKVLASLARFWWNTAQFPIERHDDVPAVHRWNRGQELLAMLTLVIAAVAVLLPNLSFPLIEPDETRYAQIAIEMNQSGDWVTPTLDGQPYLDKPPLMYWMTAVCFKWFGTTLVASRIPSVLSALSTIVLIFCLGRLFLGSRAAWLGSIALLLCGGFVLAGRFLILDGLLSLFIVASFLTGYLAVRGTRHRRLWWLLSGIACGLGVLTKGPVALVLCAPPLAVSGWLRRDQTQTRLWHWIAFVFPVLLICVPWYVAVWKSNPQFGDHFFLKHHWDRFTTGSNHQHGIWFYIPVLFVGMFPASLLLPTLGAFLVSRNERKRRLRSKDLGFLFCCASWILVFFSVASCKLPTYILPAIPLICLMMGQMLDHTVFKPELTNRITTYLKPFPQRANMILACGGGIAWGLDVALGGSTGLPTILMLVLAGVVIAITLVTWNQPWAFSRQGWGLTAAFGLLLLTFFSSQLLPTIATKRSIYDGVAALAKEFPDAKIVFYGEKPHAAKMRFPRRDVSYWDMSDGDQFSDVIASSDRVIVVTDDRKQASTRSLIADTHRLLPTDLNKRVFLAAPVSPDFARVGLKRMRVGKKGQVSF